MAGKDWFGVDRSTLTWYPTIVSDKCTGCGLFVVTCGEKRNVFGFNVDTKKSVVLAPQHCMVGCDNCASNCLWDAIHFPHDSAYVQNLSRSIGKELIEQELKKKLAENPQLVLE